MSAHISYLGSGRFFFGRGSMFSISDLRALLLSVVVILLAACGGGGGGGTTQPDGPEQGRFIDSAVAGLYYEASPSGLTGFTDADGIFEYEAGDTVEFFLGDILIGEAPGALVITPVSLVGGDADETDPVVLNIARLLQTLDDNNDPSDGINITTAVFDAAMDQAISFTDTAGFDSAATALLNDIFTEVGMAAPTLVSAGDAEAHLAGSLLSENSGTYSGTWLQTVGPDSDNGVWTFTIDSTGDLTGCGKSNVNANEIFTLSGTMTPGGSVAVGTNNAGATFSGTIDSNGNLTGTWSGTIEVISGTFAGSGTTNPSIDCSSLIPGVPGPGGGSGDFGNLTISGDAGFGDTFSAIVSVPTISPAVTRATIAWSSTPGFASTLVGRMVSIAFRTSTNEVTEVYAADSGPGLLLYQLLCFEGDCSGISIDQTTRTVTFNNLTVPVQDFQSNTATAPITLTGTLTYPAP